MATVGLATALLVLGSALALAFEFDAKVDYPVASAPVSVAVGDLTGDGAADLAVASNSTSNVSVLEGNPDGTFEPAVDYPTGNSAISVAVGDLNRDGRRDLAVVVAPSGASRDVAILEGRRNGGFKARVPYPTGFASFSQSIMIGDFDRDGRRDLVTADGSDDTVSILEGKRDGTFKPKVDYPTLGDLAVSVAVGDFDRDGRQDLAVANSGDDSVSILEGKSDGTFKDAVLYPVGPPPIGGSSSPQAIRVADLNHDGKRDLAVANGVGADVSILRGKSDGTFRPAVDYPVGSGFPRSIAIADLDRDGNKDVVVGKQDSDEISILGGNGDATFEAAEDFPVTDRPRSVAVGDFDGVSGRDVAATNEEVDSISILLNAP